MTSISAGCAGGRMQAQADDLDYPVSLSKALFDKKGKVVIPTEDQKVEHFSLSLPKWTIFWSLVPLSDPDHDLSKELQSIIERSGGDAIVNLTVETSGNLLSILACLIPVIPSSAGVVIEGDVVKMAGS